MPALAPALALEAIEEQISLRRTYPGVFFTPNGAQESLINAVAAHPQDSGRVITYLWSGANDGGKTRCLSEIACALAVGPQSDWFRRGLFQAMKRPCRVRVVSTDSALKEGLLREFAALLGPYLAPGYPKQGGHTYAAHWLLKNGSRIDVYTWDQGMTTHAGAFIDALILDEPGPRGVYDEATARLRRGGPVVWGLTPVDSKGGTSAEVGWIFDEISRAEEKREGATWKVFYSDAEDNCVEHGVRGRVPHAVIADRMERWKHDPAALKARFYGRHALELGRVLKEWDDAKHIFTRVDIHPSWPRYCSIDTHPSKPQVILYGALTPFNEFLVLREIVSTGLIRDVAQELRNVFLAFGFPRLTLIDPLANTPNPVTGETVFSVYQQHLPGANLSSAGAEKAEKTVGIAMLREMLAGIDGRPLLKVHESCKFTISQAKRWMIDPRTLQPAKEHDDAWECLYRIVLNLPAYPSQQMQDMNKRMSRSTRSSLVV